MCAKRSTGIMKNVNNVNAAFDGNCFLGHLHASNNRGLKIAMKSNNIYMIHNASKLSCYLYNGESRQSMRVKRTKKYSPNVWATGGGQQGVFNWCI